MSNDAEPFAGAESPDERDRSTESVRTIGYGGDGLDLFIDRVRSTGADHVVDVRSVPFSRHRPEFNGPELEAALASAGVRYTFAGDQLGGRPDDPSCYTPDGRVDYAQAAHRGPFLDGIDRVVRATRRGTRLLLMCSEGKPESCHRSKLIGKELSRRGVHVVHVEPDGTETEQDRVLDRLAMGQQSLGFVDPAGESSGTYGPDGRRS